MIVPFAKRSSISDGARRLSDRHHLVLLTDGEASYARLFAEIFGQPYQPARQGTRGRFPAVRYRIPRTLAHVQIIKHRQGRRVVRTEIRYPHGSRAYVQRILTHLGYAQPNTSAIERRNGTARRMSAHQVRKSLAFSRRPATKRALGWWALTVYNWCRPHRSLRHPLAAPQGKKNTSHAPLPWLWGWPTISYRSVSCFSLLSSPKRSEIISHDYLSAAIGVFAGFLGVGPGFLMMPALVLLGYTARLAAATNSVIVTLPSSQPL